MYALKIPLQFGERTKNSQFIFPHNFEVTSSTDFLIKFPNNSISLFNQTILISFSFN